MSRLSTGQPITYDFLADLENKVNALSKSISNIEQTNSRKNQNIKVAGRNIGNANNVVIDAGFRVIGGGNQKTTFNENIKFDTQFAQEPLVVATLHNPKDKGAEDENSPYATILIGYVSTSGFNLIIQMMSGSTANRDLRVNYIAVGKGSTT